VAAGAVYNNLRVSRAETELLSIAQAVRTLYATSSVTGDAAGTNESGAFCKASVFPTDMIPKAGCPAVAAASTLIDPWNNIVTATSQTVTTAGDAFGIEFTGVTQGACINMLTAATGEGRDPGLYYANATAAPVGAAVYGAATAFPISAGTAAGLCASTAAPFNSVQFVFQLKG
jgi:hypothetical protein